MTTIIHLMGGGRTQGFRGLNASAALFRRDIGFLYRVYRGVYCSGLRDIARY